MAAMGLDTAPPTLFPGAEPGKAKAQVTDSSATLSNKLFTATYSVQDNSVTFGGLTAANGTPLLCQGNVLFTIHLADGRVYDSTNMTLSDWGSTKLSADGDATHAAERSRGRSISGVFTAPDGALSVKWTAILRNDSHYLRQNITITAGNHPLSVKEIVALNYSAAEGTGTPTISGNTTHGRVVENDALFFGLETPMSIMLAGHDGLPASTWAPDSWKVNSFGSAFNLPDSFRKAYGERYAATNGPVLRHLKQAEGSVTFAEGGPCTMTFKYTGGNHRLNVVGVQLLDAEGHLLSEDVHEGYTGHQSHQNSYTVNVPEAGNYRLRYWVQTRTESVASHGDIVLSLPVEHEAVEMESRTPKNLVRGLWEREAELAPGQQWSVTGVVGLFAPQQKRRSFLAYIERERAVPYRPFVHYNDWYEIGIRIHDYQDPKMRTSEAMWLPLLDKWYTELYDKRGTKLDAFMIDDGWDDFNSLWDFHCGFPNGFAPLAKKAAKQDAGLGTWLGPVGGYGASKSMRIAYWNENHPDNRIDNFRLSNPEYFNAFVGRCRQMIKDSGLRYFKFDGISTKFHAKGPANIEDAEGILNVIAGLREEKPDVYINTTVGTWASPFWFMHSDCVWRQENDFDQMGNAGDARDRWITYRDRLVHEVFVQGAPLFPINSIMTHGTIISKNGPPHIMSRDPENCRKEMRMAFGCGSSLQEIYADNDLLSQKDGALWDELAACIAWVRRNADVLPDVHWVGGNPWDGQDGDIYGYAAWNREKATLTLRNSSATEKTLQTTLRAILDVPPSVKGSVTFSNSFADQRELGLTKGAINVDAPITITMQPQEVIVLEGQCKM